MRSLGSDNHSGVHPDVLAALIAANADHAPAYGGDSLTARAVECFRSHLGEQAQVFMTFGGTGANVLGLQSVMRSWQAVIAATTAHINVDEAAAPEKFLGAKIIDLPTTDGRLSVEAIEAVQWRIGDAHQVQPAVVLITESTEYGTVYRPEEIRAIADAAHARGLLLYLDGARIANAAASLGVPLRALTTDAGVDVMSFGGTKNGAMYAEAVVVLNADLDLNLSLNHLRMQSMQLASKMRYPAAQFVALLEGDLWRRNAEQANAMATRLADGVRELPDLRITQSVQANAVFATLPAEVIPGLQSVMPFHIWDPTINEVRWVCSWDTTSQEIDAFIEAVRTALT